MTRPPAALLGTTSGIEVNSKLLQRNFREVEFPRRARSQSRAEKTPGTFANALLSRAQRMIKTEHLSKRYDSLTAVDDVSFEVGPGEVLGFLGPNGAGKSTTMRMLAGFITPTAGSASICGHDVENDALAAKACLGYLPEGAPSYGEMTVRALPRLHRRPARARGRAAHASGWRTSSSACSSSGCSSRPSRRSPRASGAASASRRRSARPAGADPRRAHRRPRSQPEARSAHADQRDGARQDHRHLHAHPRRSRRGLHPRHHHRARPHRRRRHAGRARGALALSQRRVAAARAAGPAGGGTRRAVAALPIGRRSRGERARCAPHGAAARRAHRSWPRSQRARHAPGA